MATRALTVSFQILDDAGKTASMPVYTIFDDATATLSSIAAAVATLADDIDDIIDGQIVKISYTISQALPVSGIKTEPVSGSNVQETGLFSFPVLETAYKFAVAVPSVAAAVQDQGVIPITGVAQTFTDRASNDATTLTFVEPISQQGLGVVRKAGVTFRKHG